MAAFELSFSVKKELKKRKLLRRLIFFSFIGLFHVHIQEPASYSTTMRAFATHLFLNFIITKYLKQEVDDDLSVCVDEHSSTFIIYHFQMIKK